MQKRKNYTYVKRASGQDVSRLVRSVAFPMAAFFLSVIAVSIFKGGFGQKLMSPMLGAMWMLGAVCAFWMPSHRKSIINETLVMIISYNASLLCLRQLIAITSGVSSQMLMATFGQPMSTAVGNTVPTYLQNALYVTSIFVPLGYFGLEGKRIIQFRRNANKSRTIEQLRKLR